MIAMPQRTYFVVVMPRQQHRLFSHAEFDLTALLHLAAQLRQIPCSCDLSQRPRSGSLNWTIVLSFEDGVEWLFRSPRTYYSCLDSTTAGLLIASEAATLKYIRLNSFIPVPDVFHYRSVCHSGLVGNLY